MKLQGIILDKQTGAAVPYASVTITSPDGKYIGIGTKADANGNFLLDNIYAADPNNMNVTSTGYAPVSAWLYDDFLIDWDGRVLMDRVETELPGVVLPPAGKPQTQNLAWLLLLAIPLLNKKKTQVAGIGAISTQNVITVGAGLLLLKGFGLLQKLLESLGLGGDPTKPDQENPDSPWQPDYWKKYQSDPAVIPHLAGRDYWMKQAIEQIHDAFGITQDDYNVIKSVFDQLNSKIEVSYLSNVFTNEYDESLLSFLTDGGGILPWDGLSEAHLKTLINQVKNLPIK